MIELRGYQQAAIDSVLAYWREGGGNPLVDMATGTGKSIVIATLVQRLLTDYPDMRVLIIAHVPELLIQNATELLGIWPDAPLGIYCSKLGRRDIHRRIVFASIQSLHRLSARQLGEFDLVLVDEAHLIPADGDGMYLRLLERLREARMDMRVAGFTATPFRMTTGRLDEGEGRIFDKVVYTYGIRQGIADGFLSPLQSKRSLREVDVSRVAVRGGEYVPAEMAAAFDSEEVVKAAVADLVEIGADRKSWLLFCAGVDHARHVRDEVRRHGIQCETITGETPVGQRIRWIADFRARRLQSLTSVGVLTTGSNLPCTDLVALLLSTKSAGKFIQIVGRGTRLFAGKTDCMVLDYGGNARTHGPVDMIEVEGKKGVRAKECPTCHSYSPMNAGVCKWCGHEWPIEERAPPAPPAESNKARHDATADAETPILSDGTATLSRAAQRLLPVDQPVISWSASRHVKAGSPDSLKVTYLAGLQTFPEWVLIERDGFMGVKAGWWWRNHGGVEPYPETVTEALARFGELRRPDVIQTRVDGRFHEIVGRKFKAVDEAKMRATLGKVQSLMERPGTEGERAAAEAAVGRINEKLQANGSRFRGDVRREKTA